MGRADVIPDDRTYTRNHEWVKLDGVVVRMGVTAPLLRHIGPLIALELPAPEDEMMLGVPLGAVEGLEGIHQIMPPADASVLDVNKNLEWDVDVLAKDPYGEGWLLTIKVHEPDQLRSLLAPSAYRELCKGHWGEKADLDP